MASHSIDRFSGVYEIVNLLNGRRYIGSAVKIRRRFFVHQSTLRRGIHHNRYLQCSWNQYGSSAFRFTVLFLCDKNDLIFYEQRTIDALKPEYNLAPLAGSGLGVRWTDQRKQEWSEFQRARAYFRGRKHTPETIALMSAAKRGNTATKGKKKARAGVERTAAAHRGMRRSEETRLRISRAMSGKMRGPKSVEHRARLSAALKGRSTLTPEALERMATTKRGKSLSTEHRIKIGKASLLAGERRKASALSE